MTGMSRHTLSPAPSRASQDAQTVHSTAGALLHKAHNSLRRSSSKRHKSQASSSLPLSDTLLADRGHHPADAPEHAMRPAARPARSAIHRTPSAPFDVPATKVSLGGAEDDKVPQSAIEATMIVAPFADSHKHGVPLAQSRSAGSAPPSINEQYPPGNAVPVAVPIAAPVRPVPTQPPGTQNPHAIYQHIHEMASKRISTLHYMRNAHEGRIYWFNTVHFSSSDLSKLPSFMPARLARRATNYFLLGLSIPTVLDMHPQPPAQSPAAASPTIVYEYLRTLSALLGEFESFQQLHPPDGSNASSLSRARIPQMFKRAAHTTTKGRRSSSTGVVSEIGLPMPQPAPFSSSATPIATPSPNPSGPRGPDPSHTHPHAHNHSTTPSVDTSSSFSSSASTLVGPPPAPATTTSLSPPAAFPHTPTPLNLAQSTSFPFPFFASAESHTSNANANSTLLPNEQAYTHLLTPPLPFAPDFHAVFATLCDVLIEAYQRILQLIASPAVCSVGVGEIFAKCDGRLRKVVVGGIVREFEGMAREGARREIGGVQRVVLGGLMGR